MSHLLESKIKERKIVQDFSEEKLAGRSLDSIYMESHQQSNIFLSIFPMNTVNFHAHQTVNEVLARQNVEKT